LHIWFISLAYGFSCMMHNLSKMMVIPDSAGDASCVRMHAYETYKTYFEYCVYKFMNVPVL
jgi:hypothetical protein